MRYDHMDIKKLPTRLDKSQETRKTESLFQTLFQRVNGSKDCAPALSKSKKRVWSSSKQDKKSQEKKESLEGNANVEAVKDLFLVVRNS